MKTGVIFRNNPKTRRVITEANLFVRHPIAAFFSFTLLLSWSIWFLAPVMSGADRYLFDSLVQIGSFGPAIAAWIVASLVNPKPTYTSFFKGLPSSSLPTRSHLRSGGSDAQS
jgi:hypothetical protein